MFIHPNLAVKLIPLSELEIIFKKFFLDRLDQELTFEAFPFRTAAGTAA